MIVLSLFDGMSCGRIALQELGIPIEKYYASEVDKFAIKNTMANFPDTIQLGDVRNIDGRALGHVDMLIGGSPCQSFSFAGKRTGMSTKEKEEIYTLSRYMELKAAGFEFEGQSYLFWEYMRILTELRETNPDILFLLENVEMGKKWEKVLSDAIGITGVHINSALVSAQNRRRIYWTNIRARKLNLFDGWYSAIPQPKDRELYLKDILDSKVDEKYYLKEETVKSLLDYNDRNEKAGNGFRAKFLEPRTDGKTNTITTVQKDNLIMQLNPSKESNGAQPYQQNRVYGPNGIAPALMEGTGGRTIKVLETEGGQTPRIRRLTPIECARLQTVPTWYKFAVSETQQYKMLGNGWTVEVIKHIFSFLPDHFKK